MSAIHIYLFDLDGTLTDAREGLFSSFRAALKALRLDELSDKRLELFLGTPLPEMFRVLKPEISRGEITAGIDAFRTAYETTGIQKNTLYSGVLPMLREIRRLKRGCWIVTSKPQAYAEQVATDLGITPFFDGVIGAGLDENDTKGELVARALQRAAAQGAAFEPSNVLMLGDRFYDVVGALENVVVPVGALWGYGSREELYGAGCRYFVSSPVEFHRRFVGGVVEQTVADVSHG